MKKKKRHTVATVLGIVLAVLIVAGLLYFAYVFFQVETINIKGNVSFDSAYIEGLAAVPTGTHMLEVDEETVKENVEKEPYLQVVSVTKKLPKTIEIEVLERQPEAIIVYTNHYLLSDREANILEAISARPAENYPLVEGISVNAVNLGEQLVTDDGFKLTVMGEILAEMETKDLFALIDTVDLSNVNNIRMISKDGLMIKFGQADKIPEKMKWIKNRLPELAKEGKSSGVLDVSAGSFATYRLEDADVQAASQTTDTPTSPEQPVPSDAPQETEALQEEQVTAESGA